MRSSRSRRSGSNLKVLWFDDDASLPISVLERIIDVCGEFEDLWHAGENPRIENFVARAREPERAELLAALLAVELELRFRSGESPGLDEYLTRFPERAARIRMVYDRVRDDDQTHADDSLGMNPSRGGTGIGGSSRLRTQGGSRDASVQGTEGPVTCRSGGGWGKEEPPTSPSLEGNQVGDDADLEDQRDLPTMSEHGQGPAFTDRPDADLTFVLNEVEVRDAVSAEEASGEADDLQEPLPKPPGMSPPNVRNPAVVPKTHGPPPRRTGRYTLERLIDSGMFGDVYLANDDMLHRKVALKGPRLGASVSSAKVDAFLVEARNAAQLRHPGIVRVYDVVQRKDVGGIFVVMEYIEGSTLRDLLRTERFPPERTAALLAAVADATAYAHSMRFIHRDLKPANILIDEHGMPHIVDFGLAVDEEMLREHAGELAGTIPYMAPEQIRGASHRLDGRTDIWALGVILYEMLTGSRPFPSERVKAYDAILYGSPRPPRDADPSIPAELERICLKCLSKRMGERYASAGELVEDLRRWLASRDPALLGSGSAWNLAILSGSGEHSSAKTSVLSRLAQAGPDQARVVPKGLRQFSPEDAPFFLDLMPGPRDRNGLPESARFWKTRIDSIDRETAFTVGLLNGPSGCGKSSLVQAGILPRLAPHVLTVSLSVTRDGAEVELLKRIRQRCPGLSSSLGLAESVRALREGTGLPPGKKLLVVLDQFEQWLQTNGDRDDAPLVEALRQCDGARVQALILVRDDFWMALYRLFRNLEVELSSERNMAAVDLFDRRHARAVLAAFGRGHGSLSDDPDAVEPDQAEFLDRAVDGLAEGGRVVCVRLALFADMFKNRPWTPATLDEIGGIHGVGIAFLENALGGRAQHPVLRPHRAAAIAVLEALLPPAGVQIKGRMRSVRELSEIAGYADRPKDFEAILRVLDGELRLITPTEPESTGDGESGWIHSPAPSRGERGPHYQLTHDYLVPTIREWLERRKRETSRGRARMRLELLTEVWGERPEPRYLPTFLEWLLIRWHTLPSEWSSVERAMMNAATIRLGWKMLAVLLVIGVFVGFESRHTQGHNATVWLELAQMSKNRALPDALRKLHSHVPQFRSQLERQADDRNTPSDDRLVAILALMDGRIPLSEAAVEFLFERLLAKSTPPDEIALVRDCIKASGDGPSLVVPLWEVVRDPAESPGRIVRAGCVLAGVVPHLPHWTTPELPTSRHPGVTPANNVAQAFKHVAQALDRAGIYGSNDWRSLLKNCPELAKLLDSSKP